VGGSEHATKESDLMRVDWYGQSSFRLSTGDHTVFIDPFGDVSALSQRGLQWDYPAIAG
jgi:L-ascorbate metabolism protein UlaG (beta-lactamase superfamily)